MPFLQPELSLTGPDYSRVYPTGSFTGSQNVSLRPNEAWRDVLLGDATLPLFFRVKTIFLVVVVQCALLNVCCR